MIAVQQKTGERHLPSLVLAAPKASPPVKGWVTRSAFSLSKMYFLHAVLPLLGRCATFDCCWIPRGLFLTWGWAEMPIVSRPRSARLAASRCYYGFVTQY